MVRVTWSGSGTWAPKNQEVIYQLSNIEEAVVHDTLTSGPTT